MTKPLATRLSYLALSVTILSTVPACSTMKDWVKPFEDSVVNAELPDKSETVKQFESTRDKAMLSAADARWQNDDIRGCESTLLRLLSRSPNCVSAQLMLADLYAETNRLELAEDQLRMAINQHPENSEAQHAMGLVLEQMGDVGAMKYFEVAAGLDPMNEIFRLSLETAGTAIQLAKEESVPVVLASATLPVKESEKPSTGLTLRFSDSDSAATTPQKAYPRTAVGNSGIEERVEELKEILESLPADSSEVARPLSKQQPMIRLPS
ncbi:MAG: tetratricopeptide (TPR) repeat protein [Pirellulaceae bacterium]|jgi:tetratricopeptide (TPR) repeat protein